VTGLSGGAGRYRGSPGAAGELGKCAEATFDGLQLGLERGQFGVDGLGARGCVAALALACSSSEACSRLNSDASEPASTPRTPMPVNMIAMRRARRWCGARCRRSRRLSG
jgi:hypothetical protein